jgi:hypothetical protein
MSEHSYDEIILAARLSYKAYSHSNHSVDNIEFYHVDIDGAQYLSFKGTSKNEGFKGWLGLLWDIVSDIRFLPSTDTNYGLGRHPAGFLEAAEDLVEYIFYGDNPIDPTKPTFLAGHSLGGAALLIAAPVLVAHGMEVKSLITFGAPNVGRLPEMRGTDILCLRNGRDLVSDLPPFYGDTYETTHIQGLDRGLIGDHLMQNYIETIQLLRSDGKKLCQK